MCQGIGLTADICVIQLHRKWSKIVFALAFFVFPLESRGDSETDESVYLAHRAAAGGNVTLLMDAVNHDPSVLECQDEKGEILAGNFNLMTQSISCMFY